MPLDALLPVAVAAQLLDTCSQQVRRRVWYRALLQHVRQKPPGLADRRREPFFVNLLLLPESIMEAMSPTETRYVTNRGHRCIT